MPAKHAKARHWIATGIFDALTSFHDFEQRINLKTAVNVSAGSSF
jgi:hypothetical protein